MQDNTYKYALPRLAEGIRKATYIVSPTLGAAGTNVVIEAKLPPYAITTNDGATIIKAIELADPVENIGLGFLKEAVERSNNNSGDGSTTTTILLNAILQGGLQSDGTNTVLEIKRSLDECLPLIEKQIDDQTKEITVKDVEAVAQIAGENPSLAKTLGEIYAVIGSTGIIHLEGSGGYESGYSLIEGVRFTGTGYLSSYMATEGKKAVYQKPAILVTKRKIERIQDLEPLLGALIANNTKTLIIFTDDMDSNVARALIELQKNPQRQLNVLIIKAPVLWKQYVFEDFAKVTGSTIVEDTSGVTFKNLQLDHLGSCETLICDKEETTVIGIKDIKDHIDDLEKEGTTDAKLRLSWLTTKTAILRLGSKSETELTYLRLKAEDAIHSCRLALKEGVVPGCGLALFRASQKMPATVGGLILKEALKQPMRQIIENAGKSLEELAVYKGELVAAEPDRIFDAKLGKIVPTSESGIIDAALVVKGAIRNALGIASTILTSSSVITLVEEPLSTNPMPF